MPLGLCCFCYSCLNGLRQASYASYQWGPLVLFMYIGQLKAFALAWAYQYPLALILDILLNFSVQALVFLMCRIGCMTLSMYCVILLEKKEKQMPSR